MSKLKLKIADCKIILKAIEQGGEEDREKQPEKV